MVQQPEKNQHDVKVNKMYCQASKYKNKYIQLILLHIVQFIYCRYTYSIKYSSVFTFENNKVRQSKERYSLNLSQIWCVVKA